MAAVATPNLAAAAAGRDIFLRGGNAIDAAVAAMLACCVVEPGMVGLGGYGGSMVAYLANSTSPAARGQTVAIDFDSRAPLAYRPKSFIDGAANYESGSLSITVPAVVAGLGMAANRFGTLPWSTVSEPAIALAEDGFTFSPKLSKRFDDWASKSDPASRQAIFPGGIPPAVGANWVQGDLARLLRQLATDGPRAFYHGDIARIIVEQVRKRGGILTAEDFETYRPTIIEPLSIEYRGHCVLTPPPPSGGLTTLQILKVLEQFDVSALEPWGAEYFHLAAEASKLCWQDRSVYLGDPEWESIPVDRLLSLAAARDKAEQIKRNWKAVRKAAAGDPLGPHDTVNVLAADTAGNIVSVTATHGYLFGSGIAIDGLGLVMNHGMSRFDPDPGSPNAAAPGKRMYHNMSPTIVLGRDGEPLAAVGLPGGPKIVTVTAQLIVSLIDFRSPPTAAVRAGRIHCEADEPIAVSSAVPESVIEELRKIGHSVRRGQDVGGPPAEVGGAANALFLEPGSGAAMAASQAGDGAAVTIDLAATA
jgi:gamma-glutamyltranspeptidase / glutathione hydrolase